MNKKVEEILSKQFESSLYGSRFKMCKSEIILLSDDDFDKLYQHVIQPGLELCQNECDTIIIGNVIFKK